MRRSLSVAVFALVLSTFLTAQDPTGRIEGTIKDVTGGTLPGVTLTLSGNPLTERERKTFTDGGGRYAFTAVPFGEYTVTATLQGFGTLTARVSVTSATPVIVNGAMNIGGRAETLTVTGAAATADMQNATRTTSLDRNVLDNLPAGSNVWNMRK